MTRWGGGATVWLNDTCPCAPDRLHCHATLSNLRISCLWYNYMKVTPTRGSNVGYSFYGTGMMPLEESAIHPDLTYGGVQFGYSESLVRMFYPAGAAGCLIRVDEHYGGGKYQQCARQATVKVTIWGGEAFLNVASLIVEAFSHPRKTCQCVDTPRRPVPIKNPHFY